MTQSTVEGAARAAETVPSVHRSILVIGGGIAGITAAVEAAEAGYQVYIVEKNPYLGGRVAQLNKYFPKLCPPYCGLEINFQRIRKEPRVRFFTLAEVERLTGRTGQFEATLVLHPRYVNDRCTACGDCVRVCPVDRPNAFNYGMDTTKAIYLPHELAVPMKYVIDGTACKMAECARCVEACGYGAIDLAMQPRTLTLQVGAVVVATGWKPYDAGRIDNLGFGRYPDVITNVMMERLAAPNGPTKGQILRPSDGKPVESAAFVQCAGSRDVNHLGYCSGICCLASLKEATYLREQNPTAKAHVFYIDLRTPGTYDFFARKVLADPNVSITNGKVARIVEDPATRRLTVEAEDILSAAKTTVTVDLVVLASGMVSSLEGTAPSAGVGLDADAFVVPDASGEGIVAAGSARSPGDVATATQEGTAAALRAIQAIQAAARR
ncbi:MAG: CoB--CoM heterodisulfide reductase iron-sulfur subunit A family protein [Candidatus Rokubacteria bacterium]|nr:CoB--CoM heterodisulfide reductase iron-sulfur subunit A family protein [Candidatus Rokubacteria bacterium]MBI2527421.1 CoB--CoM heterodisulfide reductase iron-sulfur subunit A family protein [Candidatus Rokubacteria bacterium]